MKCLRCGSELTDNGVFCSRCSQVTAVPLSPSPYLSKKIQLPKRKSVQITKKQDGKKAPKKKKRSRFPILFSLLTIVLCGAFFCQGAFYYQENARLSTEASRLQSVEDECVRLTEKLRQAEQAATALEAELANLGSDAYIATRNELKAVTAEKTNLERELARSRDTIRSLEEKLEDLRKKTEFFDTHIVFIPEGKAKLFHSYDCKDFSRQDYSVYSKQEAVSLGYSPCSLCQ